MEILENIIHTQSLQRIELLSLLSTISYFVLLPYIGLLLGSTLLSCMFNGKGKRYKNAAYIKLSRDLINIPTFNIWASLGLVLLPLFSLMLIYAQIVQSLSQLVFDNLLFSVFLIVPAIFLIYIYKDSFELSDISKLVNYSNENSQHTEDNFSIYSFKTIKLLTNSSRIAFYLLLASSYIIFSGISLINNSANWGVSSFSDMIFSGSALISFLQFLALSFSLTSVAALFIYFKPSQIIGEYSEYHLFIKKFLLNTAMIFLLALPVLYTLDVMAVPQVALSNSLFGISIFVLLFLLLMVSSLYYMIKENRLHFRGVLFFLFIGLFALLALKIQVSFNTSAQIKVNEIVNLTK